MNATRCSIRASRFPVNVLRDMVGSERENGGLLAVDTGEVGHGWVFASLGGFVGPYQPLYCIDGCNGFDPFIFVEAARKRGENPQTVLEHIFVSRVFTCHQMASLVRDELPALAVQKPKPLLAVLGVADLFYDENLPFWEREYLYRRTLHHLEQAGRAGLPLVITFRNRPEGDGGKLWRWLLRKHANRMVRLEQEPEAPPETRKLRNGKAPRSQKAMALFTPLTGR